MDKLDEIIGELHYLVGYTCAMSKAQENATHEAGAHIHKKLQMILLALKEVLK